MKGQLSVNHGPFRTSGVGWAYGLEYIAANLKSPAVVLHWPSHAELVAELRRHRYDYVGVSFTLQLYDRMRETVRLVRRHAPQARVVLGGYGTMLPAAARHASLVCHGEGIDYMRRLLDERMGEPLTHPTIVYGNRLLSLPVRAGRKLVVCTGLGCPNGCDFCASSHKFGRTYVPLVESGDELFSVMNDLFERTGIDEFSVLDENFLRYEERARTLGDRCEAAGRHFEFFTFSSIRALERYTADDLVRIGVSAVWIGLEGKQAGYDKLHGERIADLARRLKHHGILVCGSMIIGLDYQTPDIVRQELAEVLEADLTYLQCLLYGPVPGTALFERIGRERRWIDGGIGRAVPYGRCDGFELGFVHPHLGAEEAAALQRECYDEDLCHGGYSIYRAMETWLEGWENLREAPQGFLRARARVYERKLSACRPLLAVGISHAPSSRARRRMVAVRQALSEAFGPWRPKERALERLVLPVAARWTAFKLRHDLFQQPALIRRRYRC